MPCQTPVPIVPIDVREDSVATAELTKVPVVGSVTFVAPVDVRVIEFAPAVTSVLPFTMVSVPVLVVIVKPLMLVAVATPKAGVVKLGESSGASECVPAGSVEFVVAVDVIVVAKAPAVIKEPPSTKVSVAPVAGAVNVSLLIVPGRRNAEGMLSVQVPVVVIVQVPVAVIWLAVPAMTALVTVPVPDIVAHFTPSVLAASAIKAWPSLPTPSRCKVVPSSTSKSPLVVSGVFASTISPVIVAAVPEAFPVTFPEKVPVVVPGNVTLVGKLSVHDPAPVIGDAPVTVI